MAESTSNETPPDKFKWTEQMEEDLMEKYRDYECLYNAKGNSMKHHDLREQAMEALEKKFDIPGKIKVLAS